MTATGTVREIPILPDDARSLTFLGETAGYTDTFLVDVAVEQRSAEAWGRLALEKAPAPLRAALAPGWAGLGLRHGSVDSTEHVLGWPIRSRTEDHMLLGAESRLGMPAELLFARWEGGLLFATVIRFERIAMRAVWAGIERPHKRVVRTLLTDAARRAATMDRELVAPRPRSPRPSPGRRRAVRGSVR